MWPLISFLTKVITAGYVISRLWRYLIVQRGRGMWENIVPRSQANGREFRASSPCPSAAEGYVIGPSKTVYISAPPKPQPQPAPAASTPLEVEQQCAGGQEEEAIEVSTGHASEHVSEADLPAALEPAEDEMTLGVTIQELEEAAEVLHGVKTGEEAMERAAQTLYRVTQAGVIEFDAEKEGMQEKVVRLLESRNLSTPHLPKWSDEAFETMIF